jgi:hypothetical protein
LRGARQGQAEEGNTPTGPAERTGSGRCGLARSTGSAIPAESAGSTDEAHATVRIRAAPDARAGRASRDYPKRR